MEELEERVTPVVITPEPASAVPGPAGNLVELRRASINLTNSISYTDFLFGLPISDPRLLADGFDNGNKVVSYDDGGGTPTINGIAPKAINNANIATLVKSGFAVTNTEIGIIASGYIFFPQTGAWTMDVGADDSAALFMGRENAQIVMHDTGGGYTHYTGVANILQVGWYHYTLIFNNSGGGGGVTLGTSNPIAQPALKLVGDPSSAVQVVQYMTGQTEPQFVLSSYNALTSTGVANPISIATGTLNGQTQIVTDGANSQGNVASLLSNGDGTTTLTGATAVPQGLGIAVGDINGDGVPDIAVANPAAMTVSILVGVGNGNFTAVAGSPFMDANVPESVAIGDVNGDGLADVVVGDQLNTVTVFLNQGIGSNPMFMTPGPIAIPNSTINDLRSIKLADFNGDGKLDILAGNFTVTAQSPSNVYYLQNNPTAGNGTGFNTPVGFNTNNSTNDRVNAIAVGDFNNDGKPDFVTANFGTGTISFFLNVGNGTFVQAGFAPLGFPVNTSEAQFANIQPFSVSAADVNGDGNLDVVVASNQTNTATVVLGNGQGGVLGGPYYFPVAGASNLTNPPAGSNPAVTYVDMNNDGAPDIVETGFDNVANASTVTVLLNEGGTKTTLTTVSPNPATQGSAVTLTATVTPTVINANHPTPPVSGTMQFFSNGQLIGTATVVNGVATLVTTSLPVGTDTITATYKGDGFYVPSTAPGVPETVTKAPANGGGGGGGGGGTPANFVPHTKLPIFATGADVGGAPQVNVYDTSGNLLYAFLAYTPAFHGGVRVAVADLNGDGHPFIITAPGPGSAPLVEVFDGFTGQIVTSFFAIASPVGVGAAVPASNTPSANGSLLRGGFWTGGMFVAAGNLSGTGVDDIVVSADAGGGPEVQVFNGRTFQLESSFFALPAFFAGGVRVAVGDVNGDGHDDIITGAGRGGGPAVIVYDGISDAIIEAFYAFPATFGGGVYVAAGDLAGVGHADIIAGAGAGGGPEVAVYDGATTSLLTAFFATAPNFTGGIRVSTHNLFGSAHPDILTGTGPFVPTDVMAFDGATLAQLLNFFPYGPGFRGGAFVGG